jgi:hypothetical protein
MKKAIVLSYLVASLAFVFVVSTQSDAPAFKPMVQHGNG